MFGGVHDVITGNKFHQNRSRGFRATGVRKLGIPWLGLSPLQQFSTTRLTVIRNIRFCGVVKNVIFRRQSHSQLGLPRVLEHSSTTRLVNYSNNFLLLEYSLIPISGCKFPFTVAVFCCQLTNCWNLCKLGLRDFIMQHASLEIDLNIYVTARVWNQVFREITNIFSHFTRVFHEITKFPRYFVYWLNLCNRYSRQPLILAILLVHRTAYCILKASKDCLMITKATYQWAWFFLPHDICHSEWNN